MRSQIGMTALVGVLVSGMFVCVGQGQAQQQGIAEKVGERLDAVGRGIMREAENVGDVVRKKFDAVRTEVGRMSVPSRVYSRIHWERSLHTSPIEVHLLPNGGVLLRGRVPDGAAKARAVSIAMDTEGVAEVVDELVAAKITGASPASAPSAAPSVLPDPTTTVK
jgi:hyperosmotically inducible periplasmic protein